ncbi:MAG: MOSC domain-containing protein [Desulfocapsaceae bacterium]|nr:MOSC domain-containing protein [Desulfocapsaceae bacterium]
MPRIVSINVSPATGTDKEPVDSVTVKPDHGIIGDAHARNWHRQISLLAQESIAKMAAEHPHLRPGSFAENITTEGLDLPRLPVGTRLKAGEVELEITQIGKKCHTKCKIYDQAGNCIMPTEGIFAKVLNSGTLNAGDDISIITG